MLIPRSDGTVRLAATAFCAVGAALVAYATVRYAEGAHRAEVARRQWVEEQARSNVASARRWVSSGIALAEQVAGGAPVARLEIPRIHLDEIVLEGVGDDELDAAPGHLPGSVLPGMRGNAVISAHRDRHFDHLDELQLGDTIRTETSQSRDLWVVVSRRVVERHAPALFQAKEPLLTLTTCWPVRYFGSAPDRLIVSARPVLPVRSQSFEGDLAYRRAY